MSTRCISFECDGEQLRGVVELPEVPRPTGVLIVVGGPQYRVGSHRQFVLIARALARAGYASLRFDSRGMGDSEGPPRDFEAIERDLQHAIEALCREAPSVRQVVVWGLCDAASAALLHLHSHPRISGMVLLNPWVRTLQGQSRSLLSHYYARRMLEWSTWREVLRGRIRWRESLSSLIATLREATRMKPAPAPQSTTSGRSGDSRTLPQRMAEGLARFKGPVLLVLSGDDLTATEFKQTAGASRQWRKQLRRRNVARRDLAEANHTFSTRVWREQVERWTIEWLDALA